MAKVKCPQCKRICHETTEAYNPDIRPNGSMVELLDPWKTWGWGKFGDNRIGGATIIASAMECPLCQAPLAPSGRLSIVHDDIPAELHQKPLSVDNEQEKEKNLNETKNDTDWKKDWIESRTCPICKKVCRNKIGLSSHMRSHEDKQNND